MTAVVSTLRMDSSWQNPARGVHARRIDIRQLGEIPTPIIIAASG